MGVTVTDGAFVPVLQAARKKQAKRAKAAVRKILLKSISL